MISLQTPAGQRRCLVAVCSNERTIYRQTAQSLLTLGWGQRVTDAAKAHGFADVSVTWIHKYLSVADLRNEACAIAIATDCTHLLFLDADMVWPADVLGRMLRHHAAGIVSGLYFLKAWPHWPIALKRPRKNATTGDIDYDYDGTAHLGDKLVPEALVGMGCTLIPAALLREMARPWFAYGTDTNGRWTVTEDVGFCQAAGALKVPIWVDPTVKCGHVASHVIAEPWFERSRAEMAMLEAQQRAEAAS